MRHTPISKQIFTAEEYLKIEQTTENRHEYYDGNIFAVTGDNMNHNRIVSRIRGGLDSLLGQKGYDVFAENIKAEVIANIYYPYPDIIVTCAPEDINGTYIVRHPSMLIEVVSVNSSDDDRDLKLRNYLKLPSLQYYMLVSQYEYYIELYTRTDQQDIWAYQSFENPDAVIHFDLLDFAMPLASIYENIVFVAEEEELR